MSVEFSAKHEKKTWHIINKIIGKAKFIDNDLLKRMIIGDIESFDQRQIANSFNKFFTEIGTKFAS